MFDLFKKKDKKIKENLQEVAYRMFKEKRTIEEIEINLNISKKEIIRMIQDQKKIRRGE